MLRPLQGYDTNLALQHTMKRGTDLMVNAAPGSALLFNSLCPGGFASELANSSTIFDVQNAPPSAFD